MKVKIISDGTPKGTHVIDIDTGKELEGVQAIKWEIQTDYMAKVTLELSRIDIEIIWEVNMEAEMSEMNWEDCDETNQWNKLKADNAQLRTDNLRLQKAVDEARNLMLVAATLKEEKYSYMAMVAKDWLATNPKEKK